MAVALIIHAAMLAMEGTATSDRVGCGDWQVPYLTLRLLLPTSLISLKTTTSQSVDMRSICASGNLQRFIVICRFGPPKLSLHHFLCNGQYRLTCCWRGLLLTRAHCADRKFCQSDQDQIEAMRTTLSSYPDGEAFFSTVRNCRTLSLRGLRSRG